MIRDYNYHNWSKFMVQKHEQKPTGAHYGVLLFQNRRETIVPYDKGDSWSSHEVPETIYFAFQKKEDLETWVGEASKANKQFFFFHVSKLGSMEIKVSVSTET